MIEPKQCFDFISLICRNAQSNDLTLSKRLEIHRALTEIAGKLDQLIKNTCDRDPWALEQIGWIEWHLSAALGFDRTNGHSKGTHADWALSRVGALQSHLKLD